MVVVFSFRNLFFYAHANLHITECSLIFFFLPAFTLTVILVTQVALPALSLVDAAFLH